MTVTFIGHSDAPYNIRDELRDIVINLIVNESANTFYIGTHGNFDDLSYSVMKEIKLSYPDIEVFVVLAYMPVGKDKLYNTIDTVFPEEVASALPKYAISKRNRWMIERSDTVVAYVKREFGGAAKSKKIAIAKNKRIIYLSDAHKKSVP
jgi:uncharacterized phage-like protein YoqJ